MALPLCLLTVWQMVEQSEETAKETSSRTEIRFFSKVQHSTSPFLSPARVNRCLSLKLVSFFLLTRYNFNHLSLPNLLNTLRWPIQCFSQLCRLQRWACHKHKQYRTQTFYNSPSEDVFVTFHYLLFELFPCSIILQYPTSLQKIWFAVNCFSFWRFVFFLRSAMQAYITIFFL